MTKRRDKELQEWIDDRDKWLAKYQRLKNDSGKELKAMRDVAEFLACKADSIGKSVKKRELVSRLFVKRLNGEPLI